jgi:hypothetical protein
MTFWSETVSLLAAGTVVVPQVAGWFAMQEGFIEWDSATRHDQLRLARVDEKRFAVAPAGGQPRERPG